MNLSQVAGKIRYDCAVCGSWALFGPVMCLNVGTVANI